MFFLDVLFVLAGCSGSGSGGSTSETFIYDSAKEVAPQVAATASTAAISATSLGDALGLFYFAFQDYENPRDEGVVGMGNLYKTLWEIGQQYTFATENCTDIAERAVVSPFPTMDISGQTYNCLGNDGAMTDAYAKGFAIEKGAADTAKFLLTYRWSPDMPEHLEHGILQGTRTASTGDLNIRLIHLVEYTDSGFVVRIEVVGNETTHAVQSLRLFKHFHGSSAGFVSIVGAGVTQGTGQYFLIKTTTDSSITPAYYCIEAGATEADLLAMDQAGSPTVPTECLAYEATVEEITPLEALDVPTSITDFTNESIFLE